MWTHPSKSIIGEESKALKNKNIVIGVTGSVACYKAIDLARKLMRRGAEVYPILSPTAADFISPKLFEWATGNKPIVEYSGEVGHIQFVEHADSMVIAPATANTISKIAWGVCDTSVTLTALAMRGAKKPVVIVPAMHIQLYNSLQVLKALNRLSDLGYHILKPVVEGERAKIPDVSEIALFVETMTLRGYDLRDLRMLVTAGPTREYIDPVRFISNPSSGRMGVSIAREAYFRGAEVKLIHGPLSIEPPPWIPRIEVGTTEELLKAVIGELNKLRYDIAIFAGAPVDFKFSLKYGMKIKSSGGPFAGQLLPTPKVIKKVREKFPDLPIIGFAAETVENDDELILKAKEEMSEYKLDIVVANNVARSDIGFSSRLNEVYIINKKGDVIHVPKLPKEEIARIILDYTKELLKSSA